MAGTRKEHAGDDAPAGNLDAVRDLATSTLGGRIQDVVPVASGLGPRRFYRLLLDDARVPSAIARFEALEDPTLRPEGVAPEPELEPVRKWMEDGGLPVPRSYARGPGIDLLEDLGSRNLENAVRQADTDTRTHLYRAAASLVPRIQRLPVDPSVPSCRRFLDAPLIDYKARQVLEWVLPWSLGRAPQSSEIDAVRDAFAHIAEVCADAPQRPAHRDFQSTNLLLRAKADDHGEPLGMIDLQGALLAPPEYDLVCLLRDPHVVLPETEVGARIAETRARLPDAPSEVDFEYRFTLLTLSRCAKDLARYRYAETERGDQRYTTLIPAAAHSVRIAAIRAAPWDARLERVADLFGSLPEPSSLGGDEGASR